MCRVGHDVVAVNLAHAERARPLCLFPRLQAQVDELCVGYRAPHGHHVGKVDLVKSRFMSLARYSSTYDESGKVRPRATIILDCTTQVGIFGK